MRASTYKLRGLQSDRAFTATTASDGSYGVNVDAVSPLGDANGAEYEVTVEPPSDSKDPRHRELVRIAGATSVDINLFNSAFIYGTLFDATGAFLPNAAMLFYSHLSSASSVLVGVSQTDTTGGFRGTVATAVTPRYKRSSCPPTPRHP